MSKKVILISFVFSAVGLLSQLLMLIPFDDSQFWLFAEARHVLTILPTQAVGVQEYARAYQMPRVSASDLGFCLMLLVAAILYKTSAGREARLLRFVLAIILLVNVLAAVFSIIKPSSFRSIFQTESLLGWVLYGVALMRNVALVYFSYQALRTLRSEKVLATVPSGTPEEPVALLQEASGAQRFANAIVDLVICGAIFFTFGFQLVPDFMSWMEQTLGARNAIIILLVLARTIYYIFFEIMLGATPGKFMTESRVMDVDSDPATPRLIITRTLTRFIPFEPFSYFFNGLWHDNISYTRVVREARTGVDGSYYLLVIPAIAVLYIVQYMSMLP